MLTDALEIHFIDMVKFRSLGERDIRNNSLHRWLTYFDKDSAEDLIEEIVKMDRAIQKAERKMGFVSSDEETLRVYEMREKALSDWTSGVNHARREGLREGELKGRREILNLLKSGESLEEILKRYDNGQP